MSSSHPLPNAPPVPEEPLEQMPKSRLACEICGKTFRTHSELDRHLEQIHGHPEKTHVQRRHPEE
ncbi:MAG: hypothetical protein NWE93_08730 [Candidatus Bathyarchaeota archaeon]|nr:hypothetical protein [Candidatus Bathyarchaeota archaeon]